MKHRSIVLKAVVLTFSVTLIAAFVAYRAGAFDGLIRRSPPAGSGDDPTMIYSSKRGDIVDPAMLQPATGSTKPDLTIMGSSKSIAPLIPAQPNSPAPPPAIMGSSKSDIIIRPPAQSASGTQSQQSSNPNQPKK